MKSDSFDGLLNTELSRYLNSTKLSLSQIANKLEISKGHLSEIKNMKKRPGLDLGLKILKICNTPVTKRREWIENEFLGHSEEYELLGQTVEEGEEKHKLNSTISERLQNNLPLLNMLIDISNSGENGISVNELKEEYGEFGIRQLDFFLNQDIICLKKHQYYGSRKRFVITKKSSYQLMQTIFSNLQEKFECGTLEKTKFQFEIDDVHEDAFKELNVVFEDYMKKTAEIIKKHKAENTPGSCRVIVQNLYSMIKRNKLLILIFVLLTLSSKQSMAIGGIEGGGSARSIFITDVYNTKSDASYNASILEKEILENGSEKNKQAIQNYCPEDDQDYKYHYFAKPEVVDVSQELEEFFIDRDTVVYRSIINVKVKCNRYKRSTN
ncbi:MAG: helix-turn-helix transcriptional regulator [Halobacteriovoraceae bacterium]|nr:helix-turn-helix transcriptional regulator [Halobacteriovoraceae bacterium]